MDRSVFEAVERYVEDLFVPQDPALEAVLRSTVEAGMPQIEVSPSHGKFLHLLARMRGARRILEIGTLAGYSTIWLGRALPPDGRLISLELDSKHAEVAQSSLARAGLADRVQILVGPAVESLRQLEGEGEEPFDFVFIDADKENYTAYLDWSLRLTRPGSVIVADNVVRGGAVLSPDKADDLVAGIIAFNKALAAEPRLEAIILQQIGAKGHDGLALAVVK